MNYRSKSIWGYRTARGATRIFAIAFVSRSVNVKRLIEPGTDTLKEDGILWFCYPKKSTGIKTDISRDLGWEPLWAMGYQGVRQISIDSVWSALRFREKRFVHKSK